MKQKKYRLIDKIVIGLAIFALLVFIIGMVAQIQQDQGPHRLDAGRISCPTAATACGFIGEGGQQFSCPPGAEFKSQCSPVQP